tara:strand:- start:180098 stop:180589 length:492 start_codon:yes stop_codon:yes gene_type:complete
MTYEEQLQPLVAVAIAAALGAVTGLEREFADKPAGLRTHMFVCSASALLVLLGDGVIDRFQSEDIGSVSTDPTRIIQAIVVGISFLGAGTIVHHQDRQVEGLTTASSILFTAGIGIAVAIGQLILAAGATILAALILVVVGRVEKQIALRAAKRKEMNNKTSV